MSYLAEFTCKNPQRFRELNGLPPGTHTIKLPVLDWRKTLKVAEPTRLFFFLSEGDEHWLEYVIPGYENEEEDHGFTTNRYGDLMYGEEPLPARKLRWIYREYMRTGKLHGLGDVDLGDGALRSMPPEAHHDTQDQEDVPV